MKNIFLAACLLCLCSCDEKNGNIVTECSLLAENAFNYGYACASASYPRAECYLTIHKILFDEVTVEVVKE